MKKWYKSKTLWVNLFVAIAGLLTALLDKGQLTASQASVFTTVLAVVNLILRLMTTSKVVK